MTPLVGPDTHTSQANSTKSLQVYHHPSNHLPREKTTDLQRQNINVRMDLNEDIDQYLRYMESNLDVSDCLKRHDISSSLRARMVDWMIEVLTNFRCDDQTFFIAVSLMDRYFKYCAKPKQVGDLHITGVTCMFLASKFEDIYPLKMKTVHEKIAHKKLDIQSIKTLELDIMKSIDYKIHSPTVLDFLKVYLLDVLGIEIQNRTETKKKEEAALSANSSSSTHHTSPTAKKGEEDIEMGPGGSGKDREESKNTNENKKLSPEQEAIKV
jgi:hypothetical protein